MTVMANFSWARRPIISSFMSVKRPRRQKHANSIRRHLRRPSPYSHDESCDWNRKLTSAARERGERTLWCFGLERRVQISIDHSNNTRSESATTAAWFFSILSSIVSTDFVHCREHGSVENLKRIEDTAGFASSARETSIQVAIWQYPTSHQVAKSKWLTLPPDFTYSAKVILWIQISP